MRRLGIDIGSLSISSALVCDGKVVATTYAPHRGHIRELLEDLVGQYKKNGYDSIGIASSVFSGRDGVVDPVLAVVEGARFLAPGVRNALAIGGERYFLVFFDENGKYKEHLANPPCASGTGSFIEQQAERLDITYEELARRALIHRGKVPSIATRCAVFAKSDIIHAQQDGFSLDAIAAGLCQGIARNVLDVLVKGRELVRPLVFVGGVSFNQKITSALEEYAALPVIVPEHAACAGAIGAALLGTAAEYDISLLFSKEKTDISLRKPLERKLSHYPDWNRFRQDVEGDVEIFAEKEHELSWGTESIFSIGFDIGSTSTKSVIVDEEGNIVRGFYTRTRGEPVVAMEALVGAMKKSFGGRLPRISTVGVTGSGRKMIRTLFNADMEVNEITAHAHAAKRLQPDVDTIIEIGGQDSKFTLLKNGSVSSAQMNYVCAAGTGSFIDEQAKRLGVTLEELTGLALSGEAPFTSDRCTVYMERDLSVLLGEGWSKAALAAAVLYSVRDNYLSKVVQRNPLGNVIVFQGATARNRALVAAFEQGLGRPVHVSPYCHLAGAYGAALIAREEQKGESGFLGLDAKISFSRETCALCANHCQLLVAQQGHVKTGWGMKCGLEYEERAPEKKAPETKLMRRFTVLAERLYRDTPVHKRNSVTITLLDGLYNREYNPLWRLFLTSLGFRVAITVPAQDTLALGKGCVNSDFCAPLVLAHGLAREAVLGGATAIFYPALVNEREDQPPQRFFREKTHDAYFCYYSQYFPTILSYLTSLDCRDCLISPLIQWNTQTEEQTVKAIFEGMSLKFPDLELDEVRTAYRYAAREFAAAKAEYRARLSPPSPETIRIILLGRPYVVFDSVISLSIPDQLEKLGCEVFWQDEIDDASCEPAFGLKFYGRMHWKYGKQILRALEYCVKTPNTFPVFLSCFRCSPDSFLLTYAQEMMSAAGKPFLFLGLDELASSVGYTTRIEAAFHAFRNYLKQKTDEFKSGGMRIAKRELVSDRLEKGDTVLIPYLNKLISRFWADCFTAAGFRGEVLDTSETELNSGYAFAHGGECMPAVAIVGGMIEKARKLKLDPSATMLYIPTLCMACNFPQFPILAKNAAAAAGMAGLKVALMNTMFQGEQLPGNLPMKLFEAGVVASLIYKLYFRRRPYESKSGSCDEALARAQEILRKAFLEGRDVRAAVTEAVALFRLVETDTAVTARPRIAILGDFYVKYNEVVNRHLQELIMNSGCELVIPSFTEMAFHFFDVDARLYGDSDRHGKILRMFEARYEKIAADLLAGNEEPDWNDCVKALEGYGIKHYIPGETSLNAARALYYLSKKTIDAIVHINPMFCCPGVVTSSLFKKISRDFNLPIIDIFYDGTGDPNQILVPHLHYLKQRG
jgi:predicted CoA-substrate-specific enzyme activase